MKFSVIIPAHNEEKFIGKTLEAILDQSHPDYEVIVVDNASSDRTYDVAKSYPVTVIKEPQKGTMAACESGRVIAKGDIIVRLDADCLPDRDWLMKAEKIFESDPHVVALSGPYNYYDAGAFFRYIALWEQKYVSSFFNSFMQFIKRGAMTIGGNSMFRASILDKIGGFDRSIEFYGDDTDVAKRMAKHGRVIFTEDVVLDSSARRFKREGIMKMFYTYSYHFFRESLSDRRDRMKTNAKN